MTYNISIELLSGTTPSKGNGTSGDVDIDIIHDDNGLPYIKGKTIKGLLHDTWKSMSKHFPELQDAGKRIFGEEASFENDSIMHIDNATFGENVKLFAEKAVNRKDHPILGSKIKETLTSKRTETSIDRISGSAEKASLRKSRVINKGNILLAPITWKAEPCKEEFECLEMALKATRFMGLSRNRGRGFVRMTLEKSCETHKISDQDKRIKIDQITDYIHYRIKLKSPAIITDTGGDPNSSITLPYIPGSNIRGAFAGKVLKMRNLEFSDLILNGKVRYLNAYPEYQSMRTLPMPLTLKTEKYGKEDDENRKFVYDLSSSKWPEDQLSGTPTPFLGGISQETFIGTDIKSEIHNQRDPKKGRAWEDENGNTHGAVFNYESIQKGQVFQGIIQIHGKDENERKQLKEAILDIIEKDPSIFIGRSKSSQYGGKTDLEIVLPNPSTGRYCNYTQETLKKLDEIKKDDIFRLLFTSDCILRNPKTGQIDPSSIDSHIDNIFSKNCTIDKRYLSYRQVGGYNRKWKLELPQALAIAAGSVLVLKATDNFSSDKVKNIIDDGLGERLAEGFGRFELLTKNLREHFEIKTKPPDKTPDDLPEAPEMIKQMQKKLISNAIDLQIEIFAGDIANNLKGNPPSNSLIGRIRTKLRDKNENTIAQLKKWFGDPEKPLLKEKAMKQFQSCKIQPKDDSALSLAKWILRIVNDDECTDDLKKWLDCEQIRNNYLISEESAEIDFISISKEKRIKLMDQTLASLIEINKERQGE